MNAHALAWLGLFVIFAGLTFRRSSWGIALYMLTAYATPRGWWWGWGVLTRMTDHWALIAGLVFAAGVLLDGRPKSQQVGRSVRPVLLLLVVYALNATAVHFMFADNLEESWRGLQDLWKFVVFTFLAVAATRDEYDLKVMLFSFIAGPAFIGWGVVFEEAGSYVHGRLESVPAVVTSASNELAALMGFSIPLAGYFVFCGKKSEKLVALITCVLMLEVSLRCSSRGAMLGLIGSAVWLVVVAKGRLRHWAIAGIVLAVTAAVVQSGKGGREYQSDRLSSIFAPAEERDQSAQSRIDYWRQGLKMISDHPLGSGHAAAFKSDLGFSYIRGLGRTTYRSVHNGYLDVAAGWGVQGLIFYLAALFLAWRNVRAGISLAYLHKDRHSAFLGWCIGAVLVTQLIAAVFGSILRYEWFFWWIAMALTYQRALPTAAPSDYERESADAHPEHILNEESQYETAVLSYGYATTGPA